MRVDRFELLQLSIPLKGSFGHAASHRSSSELVLVSAHDEAGNVGWGEALPREYVTGESLASVLELHAPAIAAHWLARTLPDLDAVLAELRAQIDAPEVGRALASFGAIELALLDLAGRRFGVALAQLLGGIVGPELPAGSVIGFEVPTDKLARHCAALRFGKRRFIKLKVGAPDDEARMAVLAKVFGTLPIRIDANAAWSPDEALERLRALARFPIAWVEEPVADRNADAMRRIREELGLRVMADESVCTRADLERLVAARALDVVNVRLGKLGGVLGSQRICTACRAAGIATSLGTMVGETGVLSRAAELFGRCVPGFDHLDGKGQNAFLLAEDILDPDAESPGDDAPGLGTTVSRTRALALAVAPSISISA
jgi:L-Ala-D/L-Glu epimerase